MERRQTVSLSFFRFEGLGRPWAFARMGPARARIGRVPGIGFWKLCGSGAAEGFGPAPNMAVYAILATWPDESVARAGTRDGDAFRAYRRRAAETWTIFLSAISARGRWSGVEPFEPGGPGRDGPIAALTRATIRPRILFRFWGRVPSISKAIAADPNVAFKIGIGEVPWLHQVTFSIWPGAEAMAAFARADGPHARAIRAVREGCWFEEELYARFRILGARGTWYGERPLGALQGEAASA